LGNGRFRIHGIIVNALNEKPLADVRVILTPANASAPRTTTTGANGAFRFDDLAVGDYSLRAEGIRFPLQALTKRLDEVIITVGYGNDAGELVFRLQPEALITGTVIDERGEPVRLAKVTLFGASRQSRMQKIAQTQTNDLGGYRFPHLLPGTYFIAVDATPWYALPMGRAMASEDSWSEAESAAFNVIYPTSYYPSAAKPEDASPIRLEPGHRFVGDLILTPRPANSNGP
jgi:hypothetical protein